MTPEQIRLVRLSFDKLWPVNRRVATLFYERLFALAPETRALFQNDLEAQKMKLMGMIATAVGLLDRRELFDTSITDLGRRHSFYGVQPRHYGLVGEALIGSLEEGLGPAFTDDTRAAWIALYEEVQRLMLARKAA